MKVGHAEAKKGEIQDREMNEATPKMDESSMSTPPRDELTEKGMSGKEENWAKKAFSTFFLAATSFLAGIWYFSISAF